MLPNLPAELLLRIIDYVPRLGDKIQLSKTCQTLRQLFCTQAACWSRLDFSEYNTALTTADLLQFLKNYPIELWSGKTACNLLNAPITVIDLSGCWNLSEELIVTLVGSLRQLNELHLNGYPLFKAKVVSNLGFEHQRDHVYQTRPSHDLASMTMDLSKEPAQRLKMPFILLSSMISQLNNLHTLCIQYQDVSTHQFDSFDFSVLRHIQHLDISSCLIDPATLQTMLRKIGPGLKTLKMLNIELGSLTSLCLSQFAKQLECLHISCNEPHLLYNIRHAVLHLKALKDFRLTRLRTGDIDDVVYQLNPAVLSRLDLSPKMNIYPKPTTRSKTIARLDSGSLAPQPSQARKCLTHKRHPPEVQKMMEEADMQGQHELVRHYATTEHDLLLSDLSLEFLSHCHQLVELRLCFPTISTHALDQLLGALPRLQIFELRQRKQRKEDYLTGLKHCLALQELYLFGVWVSEGTLDCVTRKESKACAQLRHLTVVGGGRLIESKVDSIVTMGCLQTLCLGQLEGPVQWQSHVLSHKRHLTFFKDPQNQWCFA